MTYKQWCDFRELLNILHIEVESKLCDVKVEEAFDDVDLSVHDSPTKGTVAVVYFYEDKFEEEDDE